MKISFLNLQSQYDELKDEVNTAINSVLKKQYFILGEQCELFEKEFSKYLGLKETITVNSGTDALILSLRALGIKKGDEVITQSNSFIATTLAITELGATPVFVDIDNETLQIDVNKIEKCITKKTKAILVVHLYGSCCDIERVQKIAKNNNLYLVEDAAQSAGSTFNGKKLGTFGDLSAFSFYPGKNLGAYGDAGAIGVNNLLFSQKLRQLRNYGQSSKYNHVSLGINSRMDEIQAAVLRVKLKYLNKWNKKRSLVARKYNNGLQKYVNLTKIQEGANTNNHLFVIRVNDREKFRSYLLENGIETLIHYPIPIHKQLCYSYLKVKGKNLKVTEEASEQILSLPMYSELTDDQIAYILEKVQQYYDPK